MFGDNNCVIPFLFIIFIYIYNNKYVYTITDSKTSSEY